MNLISGNWSKELAKLEHIQNENRGHNLKFLGNPESIDYKGLVGFLEDILRRFLRTEASAAVGTETAVELNTGV